MMEKIKVFEMFAGYGGASFALRKAGIPFEVVGFSEIDKYASKVFEQNHGSKNWGDCRNINPIELPDFDLLTGGFPCQSFSVAGKMQGEADPRGTLFNEIIRIAEVKKPKYMLLENVKGLTSAKFKPTFDKIIHEIQRIGYNVYYKVLNSKEHGIPQSRARIWFACVRKDIDEPFSFRFPEPTELKIFIKDILEQEVDQKYYLSEKLQERFKTYLEQKGKIENPNLGGDGKLLDLNGCSGCLEGGTSGGGGTSNRPIIYDRKGFYSRTKGFRENELSPTLSTKMGTGGNNVPMVLQKSQDGIREYEEVMPTLRKEMGDNTPIISGQLRRLTPKECFRLQGFLNDEIKLEGISDTQQYKLAGNGWEINVASKILKNLLATKKKELCVRCGKQAFSETINGMLCNECECLLLSCQNNPEQEMTEQEFWAKND